MAEFSIPKAGEICWRELATKDLASAIDFYSQLFGWKLQHTQVTPMDYTEIPIDDVVSG
jgi:predicted enzyme related to lactoylglutathione lyase